MPSIATLALSSRDGDRFGDTEPPGAGLGSALLHTFTRSTKTGRYGFFPLSVEAYVAGVNLGDVQRLLGAPELSAYDACLAAVAAPSSGSHHAHQVPHQAAHRYLTAPLTAADTHVSTPDFAAAVLTSC